MMIPEPDLVEGKIGSGGRRDWLGLRQDWLRWNARLAQFKARLA